MKKTKILVCFDTEDFTSNKSCDAILDLALLLQEEGITGNFMLVGLLGWQLVNWKRWDVLDALKHHEVHYHTYGHTMHPNICESTDLEDFDEAYRALVMGEAEGVGMVKAASGRHRLLAAVPPGNSNSYVAMYAYADMGMPVYCDSLLETENTGGYYFCNAFHLSYTKSFESMVFHPDFDPQEAVESFAGKDRILLYTHPNIAYYSQFWDVVNFDQENLFPFGEWKEAERRPIVETEAYYDGIRRLLRCLKHDGRFCFETVGDVYKSMQREPLRILTKESLPRIRESLMIDFGFTRNPSFSLSELFCGVTALLKGEPTYMPGKTYGFLKAPIGVTETVEVTREGLVQTAGKLDTKKFLPESLVVDGKTIGPADYLMAALEILCFDRPRVMVAPKPQQCDLNKYPALRDFRLNQTWRHGPSLADRYLSDRLRLQIWTVRMP